MIVYFNPPNHVAALAIARAFGLTRPDSNGDEQITSTHEGSAIWHTFGDGRFIDGDGNKSQRFVKRLMLEMHTPARRAQLNARSDKASAPRGHKI